MILQKKLRSRRGETLTEILVSLAILVLSISLLVTMIMSAGKITEEVKTQDKNYNEEASAAERGDILTDESPATVVISLDGSTDSNFQVKIDVDICGKEDGTLRSYKKHEDAGT